MTTDKVKKKCDEPMNSTHNDLWELKKNLNILVNEYY